MKRNLIWKFLFVVFVVLWSFWEMNPPRNRDLMEEFQRRAENTDTNFTAIVQQARQLQGTNTSRAFASLLEAIGTNDVSRYFRFIDVSAELPNDRTLAVLHRLQRDASGRIKLGLDLRGGTQFLVEMDTNQLSQAEIKDRGALSQAVEVLRKRVDKLGVAEPNIMEAGGNSILIQLPGLSEQEKETAKVQIQKAAFLEFRLVHPQSNDLLSKGLSAIGYTNMTERVSDSRKKKGPVTPATYLIKKSPEQGLTGQYVKSAGVSINPVTNEPEINVTFTGEGSRLFAEVTRKNVGRLLAIILDGELYSAPVIEEEILGGSCRIRGNYDIKEAFQLANVLVNPLQAPVRIKEERSVDPSLGADSIRSGVTSAIYGTLAVAVFMAVYYLFAGMVANLALVLNLVILMGVMCSIGATLTLPGIAGIVLTAGMAVDANVLIFERIREELAAGKSMRGALAAGYNKAFGTIFDSNFTTLISSIILIAMGTGPVQGFGYSLTFGILTSMFTALVVTRLIFDWMLERNLLKSMKMVQMIRPTEIDFLRWAKPAFAASWLLILVGIGYGIKRGEGVLGVDFKGGDAQSLSFTQRIGVDQLRGVIGPLGVGDPQIQYQKSLANASETLQVVTRPDTAEKVLKALQDRFPEAKFGRLGLDNVGPSVGKEIQKTAVISVLLALFGILVYVAFRYEFSFAVGAVVAIFHDVLMTMGWFFLTDRELSAPMVAAILTIIGFSINDTIVIFDRIREDLKLGVRGTFKEVMNIAINQTLSRTIITSGTVFLATMSLYVFGGGVINDFAFTFLVGILTGSYSTIYIASAIVLWWHKGQRPKTGSSVSVDSATRAQPAATARV
ncbi:MAG TPA: protein translocase subunit SecD [Verrucomicrobiae bacterium]|nr:protein translocase subunit SecD [Verrucomicrobiae bacterium]